MWIPCKTKEKKRCSFNLCTYMPLSLLFKLNWNEDTASASHKLVGLFQMIHRNILPLYMLPTQMK